MSERDDPKRRYLDMRSASKIRGEVADKVSDEALGLLFGEQLFQESSQMLGVPRWSQPNCIAASLRNAMDQIKGALRKQPSAPYRLEKSVVASIVAARYFLGHVSDEFDHDLLEKYFEPDTVRTLQRARNFTLGLTANGKLKKNALQYATDEIAALQQDVEPQSRELNG